MKIKPKISNKQSPQNRSEIERCIPDYNKGLNAEQIQIRKDSGWLNTPVDSPAKTKKEIVFENTFTYFNLIFLILGLLLCLVQSYKNLSFLPVVVINTLIGIIQEFRTKNALEKMNMLNAPHSKVVRDGKEIIIKSEDLVIDDVVLLNAGNQISADAVVLEGEILVNESCLTGESIEIKKSKGDTLMSGSFVVSGECYSKLEMIGCDSYISKLTLEAKKMEKREQSEMIRALNKLVKWIGIIIIPIGIILFIQGYYINQESLRDSIVSMEAALIGMIPEGLYLLTTMALAVSTLRLAKQQVLLHNMKSIETLARVNVLCVDKTGTITENEMAVKTMIESSDYIEKYKNNISLPHLLGDFCSAMSADNITMDTLKKYFTERGEREVISITTFSSATKYSSVTFKDGSYILGAPEIVLHNNYDRYTDEIETYAKNGVRVLVFSSYDGIIDGNELTGTSTPLCYILITNPIRKEAKATFQYFAEQGVNIKVISGDNPVTVSEVAKQAGIIGAENYVDATTLSNQDIMATALQKYTVFGRVTPEQKKLIVLQLKELGNTVAMTGDGVNDILAMKEADCSIAMASGNDAAIQSAQLVLLNSDFSCMPSVVLEGRRVVNNIQRSASLFLVKNIFSFLMSVFSIVFGITYPLEPSQITLISMFTIGIPSFFLALEQNKNRIEGRFLTNVFLKALPGGITDMLAVGSLVICGTVFNLPNTDIATAATMLLVTVGFLVLYKISLPMNRFRKIVIILNMIGLLLCGIFLNHIFSLNAMSSICILLVIVFSFAAESIFRLSTALLEKIQTVSFKNFLKSSISRFL